MVWQKAKAGKSPGYHSHTEKDLKHAGWCLNNNISIGIIPDWKGNVNRWQIDININKKTYTDPHRYDNDVVYNKVNEYYKYYYDKYNKEQSL